MPYDSEKTTKLTHLKALAQKVKGELEGITSPEYTIVKQGTAEEGFFSTYYLTKDGEQVGEKINIPKDFLVNSADILTVETADQPYEGAQVGDLYIDFVINSKNADDTASHVYLPVNELVDAYTGGNGITITPQNEVSVKIDTANANGLSADASGLKMSVATTAAAGAMAAADKTKLDGFAVGATKVEASTAGKIKINDTDTTVVDFATDEEVTEMLNEVFPTEEQT